MQSLLDALAIYTVQQGSTGVAAEEQLELDENI
jgi:hypothetical protein